MQQRRFILTLILSFGITLTLSPEQKRPSWVDKIPNRPDLLQGVGFADDTGNRESDQKRAEVNAITQIINEISTTVSSQLTDFVQEDNRSGQVTSQETITKISSQYAQETISGIKVVERYYDPKQKVYYAYAVLSREELQHQMQSRAANVVRLVQDYHAYAQQALAQNNVYDALHNYCKALTELFIVQASLKQKIEGDLDGGGKREFLQVRLENEIAQIVRQIHIQAISGSHQQAQRGRGLAQPLTGRVFWVKEGKEFLLANIPLKFRLVNATGQVSENITTDVSGHFNGYVNLIESAQAATGIVKTGLYFPEIATFQSQLPTLRDIIEQVSCDFVFNIDVQASARFLVHICEEIDGTPVPRSVTTAEISKALIQNKYTVLTPAQIIPPVPLRDLDAAVRFEDYNTLTNLLKSSADYTVAGLITVEQSSSASGVLFFSKANAQIKVIDLKTGREVAAVVQTNIKGAGNDFNSANKDALRKCSQQVTQELITSLQEVLK